MSPQCMMGWMVDDSMGAWIGQAPGITFKHPRAESMLSVRDAREN